jgi:hypothetical protein
MPDPATTIGLSAVGTYVAKDVVIRLLGPTADFLGTEMKEFAQRRKEAVGRIFRNAAKKAQGRLDEPGAVLPRVLRDIVNQGSFQDDDLAVDYFGGALASSRTTLNRDDRSATFTGLVSRLSTYQIRSHFISYHILRSLFLSKHDDKFGQGRRRKGLATFIPFPVYVATMDFTNEKRGQAAGIIEHTFWGLHKENLIGDFEYGNKLTSFAHLDNGIVFEPSVLGAELFLRAHGIQAASAGDILSPDLKLSVECQIAIPTGSKAAR